MSLQLAYFLALQGVNVNAGILGASSYVLVVEEINT